MLWAIIVAVLFALDQITKTYVKNNLPLGQSNEVIQDFFYFTHVENTGAAFGILKNGRYFFIILTIIISFVLIYVMIKNKSKILRLAISIVLGGALGNFIDRLLYGKVTDFLDFYIFGYDYPVFNVADICVNIGTILLAIYIIFIYKEPNNEEAEESNEPLSSETGDGLNE
ncbi:MAG: signal peptidase II [Clostridiaceae bacterium]|jgi:signal peptidase II|nr:signal peptidase II [Clostridiaceae bacterium]